MTSGNWVHRYPPCNALETLGQVHIKIEVHQVKGPYEHVLNNQADWPHSAAVHQPQEIESQLSSRSSALTALPVACLEAKSALIL